MHNYDVKVSSLYSCEPNLATLMVPVTVCVLYLLLFSVGLGQCLSITKDEECGSLALVNTSVQKRQVSSRFPICGHWRCIIVP